jgi:hypothetical protein
VNGEVRGEGIVGSAERKEFDTGAEGVCRAGDHAKGAAAVGARRILHYHLEEVVAGRRRVARRNPGQKGSDSKE